MEGNMKFCDIKLILLAVAGGVFIVNASVKAMDNSKEPTTMTKEQKEFSTDHLTDLQKEVTMGGGTERPFKNEYWDHKEEGIYVDVINGEPLFSSTDKFSSCLLYTSPSPRDRG